MARAGTRVEDGTVYVLAGERRIEVGDLATIVDLVGGPAWTITYTEAEKERPELDTADEGLTVDVVDTIEAMTFDESFVETLAAQPAAAPAAGPAAAESEAAVADPASETPPADQSPDAPESRTDTETLSPRLGLFVGRLLENLEYGLR